MRINSMYSMRIRDNSRVLQDTVAVFRDAVDYLIPVCAAEWDDISAAESVVQKKFFVERLIHATKKRPVVKYGDFDRRFYKFPSYLRRSAVAAAIGLVSSYMSNRENWERQDAGTRGRRPRMPRAGHAFPCMYRDVMYLPDEDIYCARLKVFIRNTWDWITVPLRKSDVDYVLHHCADRKQSAPTLTRRHKRWYLDFTYTEDVELRDTGDYREVTVAAVDLGVSSAAVVSIMRSDGTVRAREFLRLGREEDSLNHMLNNIRKAQQHGAYKTPRLWNYAKGFNEDISRKTARFIVETAAKYSADVIVMEHLDPGGKKRGSGKQRLHHWRAQYVQQMVTDKAHRLGMRVSTVSARNTSRLAFDGSGRVLRGTESGKTGGSYSLCEFQGSHKVYNCDLNASYNIGARYFVREILKSLSERAESSLKAKDPSMFVRSTCTLSTLISLNAVLPECG